MKRKTILLKTSFLFACLIAGSFTAAAYDFEVNGIYYNFQNGGVDVTYKDSNYNSYSGSVIIPSTVTYNGNTYSVTGIGKSAFSSCSSLTYVSIPNSVTSIGNNAFKDCIGLTNVLIPNSVTSIGSAFWNCTGLTSVSIPNSVTTIGSSAFRGCSALTSVTIPNSVTLLGSYAFFRWIQGRIEAKIQINPDPIPNHHFCLLRHPKCRRP